MIDDMDPVWNDVYSLSAIAAGRCVRRWGRWASFDDLRGAALEYAVRRKDVIVTHLIDTTDEEDIKAGRKMFTRALERAAERFARKEKAAKLGYEIEDEYYYSPQLVERLIASHWAGGPVEAGQTNDPEEIGGRRGKKLINEGGDLLAMEADISAALDSLDPRSYGVLYSRVHEQRTLEDVAAAWDVTHQRVSQIEATALRKLVDFLGGYRP